MLSCICNKPNLHPHIIRNLRQIILIPTDRNTTFKPLLHWLQLCPWVGSVPFSNVRSIFRLHERQLQIYMKRVMCLASLKVLLEIGGDFPGRLFIDLATCYVQTYVYKLLGVLWNNSVLDKYSYIRVLLEFW